MLINNKVLLLGGIIIDSYIVTEQYPERGQDTCIKNSFDKVGGCSINVAITLRNLGCDPYIVSGVGNGHRGKIIMDYLIEQGLNTAFIKPEDGSTGYCLTLLDETGERTFLTFKGCEETLTDQILTEDLLGNMSYAYVTGYYLLNSQYKDEKLALLRQLKRNGTKIVFDPGSLVDTMDIDFLKSVLKLAHIMIPNKTEVDKIINKLNIKKEFHKWCLENDSELIIIKNGRQLLNVYTQDNHYQLEPYSVSAIDTTGAGDSFAGGFIYSLINRKSIEESMKIASACGAIATTFLEPHGTFGMDDLLQIMSTREES
ncbi:carbohydrate kinase family protein [Vallitalea okinawensis]|uniref:carbohydrate kinase family protein n=1 Tax=Vallitalea okinawensis TaxID=2078660 RepID=UPI000CFC6809|nr:carbohydrate kinase family protein [Vallitalea okinawensis]